MWFALDTVENRIFKWAMIISLSVHVVVLLSFFITKGKAIKKKHKRTEITYRIEKPRSRQAQIDSRRMKESVQNIKKDTRKFNQHGTVPVPLVKEKAKLPQSFKMAERRPEKTKGLNVTRKVSVPALKSDKINNPAYVSYYQTVRERIREMAYNNYLEMVAGEIYLTFVLHKSGALKQIKIIEERSSANDYLREVGLQSIRQSSPFPPFPKSLRYPELTFNVVISFQINEDY